MKKSALLLALAGFGLATIPAQANIRVPITFGSNFTTTLTNFADGSFADITGTGPNGTFNFGQLAFDGINNQLNVLNLTMLDNTSGDTSFLLPTDYPILDEVDFANLTLTETFSGGQPVTTALYSDPLGMDMTTITNYLDPGTLALYTPTLPAGSTLVSATLTGQFSDGTNPLGATQMTEVGAVPETSSFALLGLGLLPIGLVLSARVRAGRRTL